MSDKEFEKAKVEAKAKARKVHDAAKTIAMEGKPINRDWLDDGNYENTNEATKTWEKCTIHLKAKDARSYSEWVTITLDDGTVLLKTYYYISDYSGDFDVSTFRTGAWVDRLITYAEKDVAADKERRKQAELQEKLKPVSEIDF